MSVRPRVHRGVVVAALIAAVLAPRSAAAYLNLSVDLRGQTVRLRWAGTPIRWFASIRGAPGVSASDFQTAAARSVLDVAGRCRPRRSRFNSSASPPASPLDDDAPDARFENSRISNVFWAQPGSCSTS
jgi:hypothetical protein